MKKAVYAGLAWLLLGSAAFAQAQVGAGQVMGNSTAAQRPARAETVTAILDRALGSTRGAIIERGASNWGIVGPSATVGLAWISQGAGADPVYGVVGLAGGGCAAAITASNGGIFYSTATACAVLAGTATARLPLLSGATAAPVWGAFTLPASVTSGGVACFTSTTAMGSSGLLTTSALLLGGGAGVCPSPMGSLGTTTTVLHGNAAGPPTFAAIVSADLSITATNCTNQFVSAISTGGVGTCRSVAFADIATSSVATSAELRFGTASKLVASDVIYDVAPTITFSATQTWDFSTFLNATETLTGNITSLTCSNMKASQSGVIKLVQDGTGTRTMVAGWCSQFRWANGVRGVLSTAINAIDTLFYQCISSTECYVSLSRAQAN